MSGRLAAVLARALHETSTYECLPSVAIGGTGMPSEVVWECAPGVHLPGADALVAAIPEPVREAIEAALDVCAVCGMWPGWGDHDDNPGFRMAVGGSYHPYQPLVAP